MKKGRLMAIPAKGDPAPDFELPLGDGSNWRLSDRRGKLVVLYFYPKDDTSGCTVEAMDFTRLADDFTAAGAEVVGISPDSAKKHSKFASKHGLTHSLAADEQRTAIEAYGVWGEKSMYGRKYMGVLRTTFLLDGAGRIAEVWENVKVPGHAESVLTAARALGTAAV